MRLPSTRRRGRLAWRGLIGVAVGLAIGTSPASASQPVEFFTTSMSTAQAGGHPDLTTYFKLESPGTPEAAKNIVFNAPIGVFGNPRAITQCLPDDFALDRCPSDSQAGLITISRPLRGRPELPAGDGAGLLVLPQEDETARFAFNVPSLDIPITIPVAVRTTTDYGLRFTVHDITQLTPLSSARMTFWGFPASPIHEADRFPKGSPSHPTGCPQEEGTACNIKTPTRSGIVNSPLIDNPTTCTGELLTSTLDVETYADPTHHSAAQTIYPEPIDGCEKQVFKPVLQARPTTTETDSATGLDLILKSPQFLTFAAAPSEIKAVTVTFPPGFTVNPDSADGQTACADAQVNFDSEGPAECPDGSKIGTFSIEPALPSVSRLAYIGEPMPGQQYRLILTSSGFGINSKLVGSIKPDSQTGQLTAEFPDLPQAPFEDFELHLFSGERGLMATPTTCTVHTVTAVFYPWNTTQAEQTTTQTFSLDSGPHGSSCPGQRLPFTPFLFAAHRIHRRGL